MHRYCKKPPTNFFPFLRLSTVMQAVSEAFNLLPQSETNLEQEQNITEQFRNYFKILKDAVVSDKSLSETNIGAFIQSLSVPDDNATGIYTCGPRPLRRVTRQATWKEEPGGDDLNSTVNDLNLADFVDSQLLKIADNFLCGPNVPGFAQQLLSLSGQTQSS